MSDRASWWAKKLGQEQPAARPQQQPVYTPPPQVNQGWPGAQPPQQQQQQQPQADPNKRLSKEEFEAVMASGNPDAMGGPKTRSLMSRPGCPECGSPNYSPSKGTTTDHCYDCGWTTRFGARSA